MKEEKGLELERMVFFSDAIVAIAITLLAFNIKIDTPDNSHLVWADIGNSWHRFLAFFLSFYNISLFWRVHHRFYQHIHSLDNKLSWFNIGWLLFVIMLPFSTSLISSHFFDKPAMCFYCINVLGVTIFQNAIWDYATHPNYRTREIDGKLVYDNVVACNVAMVNSLIAIAVSLIEPGFAFLILSARLPMIMLARKIWVYSEEKKHQSRR